MINPRPLALRFELIVKIQLIMAWGFGNMVILDRSTGYTVPFNSPVAWAEESSNTSLLVFETLVFHN